ncbi:MAG: 3'(2'),5'-bisphosphate nucleotidase [Gammaproteobacteria bacterium]
MTAYELMLDAARDAVAQTCVVARQVQHAAGEMKRLTKDDYSPVTVADFAVQALVALHLRERLGSLALVGEETAADLRTARSATLRDAVVAAVCQVRPTLTEAEVLSAIDLGDHDASGDAYWTLDPIDGTKGFLRGGQYAISLAYITGGEVVLGVLGCPNLGADFAMPFDRPAPEGTLFFARRGSGTFAVPANSAGARATPVRVRTTQDLTSMRVCESVEAAHSRQDETQRIAARLGARGTPARLDSQCKYAVVARGQADAYIRMPTRADYVEKIWDHAAGMLVATEAGASVSDVDGRALDFSQGATLKKNRGIVCAPPPFHAAILDAIQVLFA